MSSRPTRPSLATAVSTVAAITVAAVALPINAAAAASRPALGPDRRTAVPDRPGTAALRWGPCPVDVAAHPAQRCADLSVPMDYRDPGGRPLTIRISRIPAADPARRLGTLVLSPGGPGIGGLDEPADRYREDEPAELRDRYDLVGFDGRGIRHSSPITCRLAGPVPLMRYPAPDGSITHTVAHARRAARSCERHAGDLLPHLTTANTARDLDRIRAALGEARISFKGLSYGTYLGAVYATLFPHRTDRVVLDSAVDPRRVWYDFIRLGGAGLAERLPDLTAWIAARPDTYRLGSTAGEVGRRYRAITAGLDAAPRPYPGVTIDGNWLRAVTREGLGMPGTAAFPVLAGYWQELAGPARAATEAAPAAAAGPAPGWPPTPAGVPGDNRQAVEYAVQCGDAAWPRDVRRYADAVRADRGRFPDDAGRSANITPCAFWRSPVAPPVRITASGPRNVLILQNRRDPATPWASGHGARLALGGRAALITADAGGHEVIGRNRCATAIALRYLVADRTRLPGDRSCPADPSPPAA